MPGNNSTQQQSQSASTGPWSGALPLLNNIASQLGTLNPSVSPQQASAANALTSGAASVPNVTPQATSGLLGLLNGGNANGFAGVLNGAYNTLQSNLTPFTSANYIDPMSNPYLGSALKTMNSDITNQIGDQFAAAGETNSPAFATALARGLSQGEGGLLTGQYNTNVGTATNAANALFGAGNATASGLTGFNQMGNQNILSGIGAAGALPGIAMAPGSAQFGAANAVAQQPFSNMGWLTSLAYPLGALGSQSQGQSQGTYTPPWTQSLAQFGQGLGNIGSFLWSDERLKDDITPVGLLFDNTPVYAFKYKGDDTPHIGVMAQDVEQTQPDAVVEVGGYKAVDYGKVAQRAVMGLLSDMQLAA